MKNQIQSFLKLTAQFTCLFLFFAISALALPHLHESWLLNKISENTVFIHNPEGANHQGSATGFEVIAPSGKIYTLTNAHVCGLQKDGVVMVSEKLHSGRSIPRRVIEIYDENDLCLVEGLEGYGGLTLADNLEVGDHNYAIGYPMAEAINLSDGFIKDFGEVTIPMEEIAPSDCHGHNLKPQTVNTFLGSFTFCVIIRNAVQTNIPIYPGNSGSPMVNEFGHVTGVIFASNTQTHWGSAVPLSYIVEFLKAY